MRVTSPVQQLLRESGAVLVRQKKHLVYQLPNGRRVTMSATPSDWRAERKQMRDIRRALA